MASVVQRLLGSTAAFTLVAFTGGPVAFAGPPSSRTAPTVPVVPNATVAPPVTAALPASSAYVLVDVDTGRILQQVNDHQLLSPASLTKMLTALVAEDYLPAGTMVPVSARDAAVEPTKIGMLAGQVWPLDETLQALLIVSANDAAYALAEQIGGTAENFGPILDGAAAQIGMADHPVFNDPSGLDDSHSIGGGNLASARDLAIAARDVLAQPRLGQIVALPALRFTGPQGTVYDLSSYNRAFLASYPGAVGVKTGFTDKAGVCIAAAATRSGRTMLAVVLHGANPDQTAKMLLDQGFATPVTAEPAADSLPAPRLPEPTPTPAPTPPAASATAPLRPAGPVGHRVAVGPSGRAALAPSGGDHPLGALWPAPFTGAALAVIGVLALRRLRRRPLAHGRRH